MMNGEVRELMDQLMKAVERSQEFVQYQSLLEGIKRQPEVYQRIGEFRRRNLGLQMSGNVSLEQNSSLQNEFSDLQSNGLANEFMVAEHQYCTMIREMQSTLLDRVHLEIDFLDE